LVLGDDVGGELVDAIAQPMAPGVVITQPDQPRDTEQTSGLLEFSTPNLGEPTWRRPDTQLRIDRPVPPISAGHQRRLHTSVRTPQKQPTVVIDSSPG